MVLKIPGQLIVDGVPVAENIRMNITENRQGRFKCTTNCDGDAKQVDIAITQFECEKSIPARTWTATAVGIDMLSKLPVSSKLVYHKAKQTCKLKLTIGTKSREFKFNSFEGVMQQLSSILQNIS